MRGSYKRIFCSDDVKYGGATEALNKGIKAEKFPMHGHDYSVKLDIPAMSVSYYTLPTKRKNPNKNGKIEKSNLQPSSQ